MNGSLTFYWFSIFVRIISLVLFSFSYTVAFDLLLFCFQFLKAFSLVKFDKTIPSHFLIWRQFYFRFLLAILFLISGSFFMCMINTQLTTLGRTFSDTEFITQKRPIFFVSLFLTSFRLLESCSLSFLFCCLLGNTFCSYALCKYPKNWNMYIYLSISELPKSSKFAR